MRSLFLIVALIVLYELLPTVQTWNPQAKVRTVISSILETGR